MTRTTTALVALLANAGTVLAQQTLTQTFDISTSPGGFIAGVTLDKFDTLNGTRSLTGVRFDVEGDLTVEVGALNFGTTPVSAGTWEIIPEFFASVNFADFLGGGGEGEGEGEGEGGFGRGLPGGGGGGGGGLDSYFATFGGFVGEPVTGDIAPGMGNPFFGTSSYTEEITGPLDGFRIETAQSVLDFFSSDGPATVPGEVGPFSAPEFFGNGQSVLAFQGDFFQTGTLTVTYSFVPAPGAFALLGMGGLAFTRRRR